MNKKQYTRDEVCLPASKLAEIVNGQDHSDNASPWRIFKIMAELVDGFEFLKKYGKSATFFGSARCSFDNKIYKETTKLASALSKDGFAIITGGGPGIMEAANKGAYEENGQSVGINIKLPMEQRINKYVKSSEAFHYFFTRKIMLSFASEVYIYFPGGFGTLDEFFEIITLVQTKKIKPVPVVLINKEYWTPLLNWIKQDVYGKNKAIDEKDMNIYKLVDNADEAIEYIRSLNIKDKGMPGEY